MSAIWKLSRAYASVQRRVRSATGLRLKGVGFLLRRLRDDHVFEACGHRWFIDHRIGGPYAALLCGAFNEPETNSFLKAVTRALPQPVTFIDVGANIGEMVVPMGRDDRVRQVIAFEPHPICIDVLRRNIELNEIRNAQVRPLLVGDGTPQPYVIDSHASPESGIRHGVAGVAATPTVRLDDVLAVSGDVVLLIDVEGAELDVIKGGRQFIADRQPLIIFEYHAGTRKQFTLDEVRAVLGSRYRLYRLRSDGKLDDDLSDTWNCVAVHKQSVFSSVTESLHAKA